MSMPKKTTRSLRCPICRTLVLSSQEDFPFCSDRCRTIDLGRWLGERYRVPAEEDEDDQSSSPEDQTDNPVT